MELLTDKNSFSHIQRIVAVEKDLQLEVKGKKKRGKFNMLEKMNNFSVSFTEFMKTSFSC